MKKKSKEIQNPEIDKMVERVSKVTKKINTYIQGNGNSKKLKKKSQKCCDGFCKSEKLLPETVEPSRILK